MYKPTDYKPNYDFVLKSSRRKYECPPKTYDGYIDIDIFTDSPLHIGTGGKIFVYGDKILVREIVRYDGQPVIPGSSFKGTIRQIAEAVSDSCVSKSKDNNIPKCTVKSNYTDKCIVCDMFGTMNWRSKVIFPDFKAYDVRTEILKCNSQYQPKKEKTGYYKFYKAAERQEKYILKKRIMIEAVKKDSVFSGKILFKDLSEEQLSLLMFSLGLDKNNPIVIKLGGHKNEGLGDIYIETVEFKCKGLGKTPADLAAQYERMNSASPKAIKILRNILK